MAKKYSVHVGINQYPELPSDSLVGCVNDANDWQRVLSAKFSFDVTGLLVDEAATKENIIKAVTNTLRLLGPGDVLVFTYSGYGSWIPDKTDVRYRQECLCPWDCGSTGAIITDSELHEVFSSRPKNSRIIFVDDSSHSGESVRYRKVMTEQMTYENGQRSAHRIRYLPSCNFLRHYKKISDRMVNKATLYYPRRSSSIHALLFDAAKSAEHGWESDFAGRPNGVLSYVMLKTLILDASIKTYKALAREISAVLPNTVSPQTPQVVGPRKWESWTLFT